LILLRFPWGDGNRGRGNRTGWGLKSLERRRLAEKILSGRHFRVIVVVAFEILDFRQSFGNQACCSLVNIPTTGQNALLHRTGNSILAKNTYRRSVLVRSARGAASAMDR
jgi:hypothetical protein